MRVADDVLDLEEEARPTADAMYDILQIDYEWNWPSRDQHLAAWKDDRGDCERDSSEDDEEYRYREEQWRAWPNVRTDLEVQWLRYAIVTSRALDYFRRYYAMTPTINNTLSRQSPYYFLPDKFKSY